MDIRNMIGRILSLALVCVLSFALFGCASLAPPTREPAAQVATTEAPKPSAEPEEAQSGQEGAEQTFVPDKELTMSIVGLGYSDAAVEEAMSKEEGLAPMDAYCIANREKAEVAYPGVPWTWNDWGEGFAREQTQRAAIAAGTPPTNIASETLIQTYIDANMLQEVPGDVLEGINPSFIATGADGKPYAVAIKASLFVLYYNKTILGEYTGDSERPPATWEQWRSVASLITSSSTDEETGVTAAWGGCIPSFPHEGGTLRATPFLRQLGVDFGGNGQILLNDPAVRQALQYIGDMNAYLLPGLSTSIDEAPLWDAFSAKGKQRIAFLVGNMRQMPDLLAGEMNLGVSTLPIPEGGQRANCLTDAVFIGVPVGIPKEEADLFWAFFRTICLEEAQLQHFVEDYHVVPVQSMLDNAALFSGNDKAAVRVAIADLNAGVYSGQAAFIQNNDRIWEILGRKVLHGIARKGSVEALCDEAQPQIEGLLR